MVMQRKQFQKAEVSKVLTFRGHIELQSALFAEYAHTNKEFGFCIYPIRELVTHTHSTPLQHIAPLPPKKHFSKSHLMTIKPFQKILPGTASDVEGLAGLLGYQSPHWCLVGTFRSSTSAISQLECAAIYVMSENVRALVMRRCHGSRINQQGVRVVYVSILIQPIKFTLSDGTNNLDRFFCLYFFECRQNKNKPKLNRSNEAIFKK